MMRAPTFLVLGDMVLDVFVDGDAPDAVSVEARAELSGSAGRFGGGIGRIRLAPGGSAANAVVGAAAAGATARMLGRVGDDPVGRLLIAELARAGVCIDGVQVDAVRPTGQVVIVRDARLQDGRMVSEPGASVALDIDAAPVALFRDVDVFHMTGFSLFRDASAESALRALTRVRERSPGAIASLDPAPAHLVERMGAAAARAMLGRLRFDVLFPNLGEGRALTGLRDPDDVARAMLQFTRLVALTLGAEGCIVASTHEVQRVPADDVRAVDTTGAGDAFAAAFLAALVAGASPVAAAVAGTHAAARVVQFVGARG